MDPENKEKFGTIVKHCDNLKAELDQQVELLCKKEGKTVLHNYAQTWSATIRLLYSMGAMEPKEAQ